MLKDKTVFHEKIQRFLYNGKMVKEVFGAWEHTKNESCKTVARKIMSMSECKHYTQTEHTHINLQKGEYVLIGISPKIPTRWYSGHIHWRKFVWMIVLFLSLAGS